MITVVLFAGLSIFVVIEILTQSIDYEKENLPVVHPPKSSYHYGYSYILAWIVFLLNIFSGILYTVLKKPYLSACM